MTQYVGMQFPNLFKHTLDGLYNEKVPCNQELSQGNHFQEYLHCLSLHS